MNTRKFIEKFMKHNQKICFGVNKCYNKIMLKSKKTSLSKFEKIFLKNQVRDVEYALQIFKRCLTLSYCDLTIAGNVANILVYN